MKWGPGVNEPTPDAYLSCEVRRVISLRPTARCVQDLKQAFPELGRGLQSLLDFEGDVESTFLHSFDVEYDYYGELRTQELKPGGSQIAVTKDNRQEYVDLYTKWLLHDSISTQFAAFAHGFHEVLCKCSFRPRHACRDLVADMLHELWTE